MTLIWLRITAAGSGRVPAVVMHSPISASLIRSIKVKNLTRKVNLSSAMCRNWRVCQTRIFMRLGWPSHWPYKQQAWSWAKHIRCRWWIMPMRGPKPCCVIRWWRKRKRLKSAPFQSLLCVRRIRGKSSSWALVPKACRERCLRQEPLLPRRKSSHKSGTSKFCSQRCFPWLKASRPI